MLVSHLINKVKRPCKDCMKDVGVTPFELDEVLLVGGMTRVPKVRELVGELFCKEPSKGVITDEAVAMGATIKGFSTEDLIIFDVIPFSLGIKTQDGVATKILVKNRMVPNRKSQVFSTAAEVRHRL
jgi:molecular chaperone DnaK